eukprot:GHVU01093530.1.p4 GENE.GHVU01093530.1~~GHVU01093530.1.p4  ORF type:complete len:100 (+),score=14.76 GHVU01093530.1:942-1241(+)
MLGDRQRQGIMMLTLTDLYSSMQQHKDDIDFQIKASFIEIYNENIRDLLSPGRDYLDLREDPVKGVTVSGICETSTGSAQEIMELLQAGMASTEAKCGG